jgi:2,6-dioxo-6-phenylhexa-3-enoate hydrolase
MAEHTYEKTSKFVTAAGVKIHYNEMGSGHPLICIHGGGPGANSWSNFRNNIDGFAAGYRAILLDMPQFGESEKVVITEGRLTYIARVLTDFMGQLAIEKAHFVGNSMGGQAAIKLAIDDPRRVDHLVVIGSTPMRHSIFTPMPVEGIKMILKYYTGAGPSRDKMRDLLQTLVYNTSLITEDMIEERYRASADPETVELFMRRQPPLQVEDLSDQIEKVRAKSLIVWGQDDRFGALDIGLTMLRKFQNARMQIFSKCGHWAQVEYADDFNRLVLDFLAH